MILAMLVQEMSNYVHSCNETHFLSRECENLASFVYKNPTRGTFDVEISLAKGIIFIKICLTNGSILETVTERTPIHEI